MMKRTNYDAVHKPSHYTEGRKFEPKDVIRDWGLNFNIGSAVKYLSRAGRKDDIVQDLRKAQEFIQFEIDAIEAEKSKAETISVKEMLSNPDPKCSFNPVFAELESGKGVCVGTLEVTVPAGADPEDIINAVISEVYGGELRCR